MKKAATKFSIEQETAIFSEAVVQAKASLPEPTGFKDDQALQNYRRKLIEKRLELVEEISQSLAKVENSLNNFEENKKHLLNSLNGDEASAVFLQAKLNTDIAKHSNQLEKNYAPQEDKITYIRDGKIVTVESKNSLAEFEYRKTQEIIIASNPEKIQEAIINMEDNQKLLTNISRIAGINR